MLVLGIVSPWLGDAWVELMEQVWFPLLAAIIIAEIALGKHWQDEARKWHEEEMNQWHQENANPEKKEEIQKTE